MRILHYVGALTLTLVAACAQQADPVSTATLVDFVEPADGEGGSEQEIASLAASLGATRTRAYHEHVWRVPAGIAVPDSPLIEGTEPDAVWSLFPGETAQPGRSGDQPAMGLPLSADPSVVGSATKKPDDPLYPQQWNMQMLHVEDAWTITTGAGVIVAVIDTGVAYKDNAGSRSRQVPDLAGTAFVAGASFCDDCLPDGLDGHTHGTHVAGTIAQTTHNGIGAIGVAPDVKIMPLAVLSPEGYGSVVDIAAAIRYAADNGAHVINMSLGGPGRSDILGKAVTYAHNAGVVIVCAAGNDSTTDVGYPAGYPESISVGSVGPENNRAYYSNYGRGVELAAPGGDMRYDDGGIVQNTIYTQDPSQNGYFWFQGTSMASPHAAAVAALVIAAGVTDPDDVREVLLATAADNGDAGLGAGTVDAAAAVTMAKKRSGGSGLPWWVYFAAVFCGGLLWLTRPVWLKVLRKARIRP